MEDWPALIANQSRFCACSVKKEHRRSTTVDIFYVVDIFYDTNTKYIPELGAHMYRR